MIDHIVASIIRHHQKAVLLLLSIGILLFGLGIYHRLSPSVRIEWTTASEVNTLGFNLVREDLTGSGNGIQINPQLILTQGSPISGSNYHFIDRDVQAGKSYIYHLQEINDHQEIVELESIEIRVEYEGLIEIGIGMIILSFAIFFSMRKQKLQTENQS